MGEFFRDLDDWSMFHATPDVRRVIGNVFGFLEPWIGFARDPWLETAWADALSGDAVARQPRCYQLVKSRPSKRTTVCQCRY